MTHTHTEAEIRRLNQELELRVAERTTELLAYTRELEAFSYSVSHDLMAPLRSINGFSKALLEDHAPNLDDTGKDYLNRICKGAEKMSALIEDLLKLSMITRMETHFATVDLSALCREIAAATPNGQKVTFTIAEGLRTRGDRGLVKIAMENLIGNAVKYSSQKTHPAVAVNETVVDGVAYICVSDNGIGFEMHQISRLFTPFQRLSPKSEFSGNGIGLAIVQRIINKHGGAIWAESVPDQGARFYLRFLAIECP
jgi:signal transduction histidine kinase